ncbi:MAG TPA: hypothetical protein VGY57_10090 [Vicinamibacterales bacterium]|jgi:hypothetical protein|nr:hypothetical protein [Vicinamibacterales bacterium]
MRISVLSAVFLAAASAFASPAALQRFDAGGAGFIDDAFALRSDGKALAYITTDGATAATIHLADVGGSDVKVPGAPVDAVALEWLSPTRVLIVRGRDGVSTAQAFTAAGPDKGKPLGPFGRFAFATVDGRRAFVTYTRSEKHGVDHSLVAYAVDTLKPLKKRVWHEDNEGQIKQGPSSVKPLWWADGFTVLAALRAGEFDKARDMRRPDRYTRLDVFSGKVIVETEVQDVLGFTQVGLTRRDAPNQSVIARFSDDRKKLLFVDGIAEYEVVLPRELWKYETSTLAWQTLDDKRVALSLTIDPVNPDAVNRKKADVDEIDLYEVDRQTHAVRPLLRLAGEGRRSSWQVSGDRIVLLRKGKGFDRGGVTLEVFPLGDESRVAKP